MDTVLVSSEYLPAFRNISLVSNKVLRVFASSDFNFDTIEITESELSRLAGISKATFNRSYIMIKRELTGLIPGCKILDINKYGRTKDLRIIVKKLPDFKKISCRNSDIYYSRENIVSLGGKNSLLFYEYLKKNLLASHSVITFSPEDIFEDRYKEPKSQAILLGRLLKEINEKTDLLVTSAKENKEIKLYIKEK